MKKLVLAVVALVANSVYSQNVEYGLKAGVNVASLYGNNTSTSSKTGIYLGGYVEKSTSSKGSLVGEAIISLQGTRINSNSTMNITQLNIPVYYKYKIVDKFYVDAGGYLGMIIGAKLDGVAVDNNTIDLGLLAGASYQISKNFMANIRYNLGLIDITNSHLQNRVFQLGITYKLK